MDPKSKSISRRDFLAATGKLSIVAVAGAGIVGCETTQSCYAPKSKVLGANERINIAMIGVGGRGNYLSKSFAKIPNVKIKTIVDIDENFYADRVKTISEIQGSAPKTEYDMR
ncbi:MAG: twin-arginine translocation signal domain-containing protein, partial [Planctomycetes bacterium]|nr:twin-arginine translocation signal domain-containing protein [Planctomycetota bacterium]